MSFKGTIVFFVSLFVILGAITVAEAGYRKPPFNGSIFGKRGSINDLEGSPKVLQAMCEIASEACQQWFSNDK